MSQERLLLTEEYLKSKKSGAVIFIIDSEGKAYVQKENESNGDTGKKPGSYSVICETGRPGENAEDNIIRGIKEESGILGENLSRVISKEMVTWETGFVEGVWSTVAVLHCKDPELFMKLVGEAGGTDGVSPLGFLPREEIENLDLRPGVRNIINKFGNEIFEYGKLNFN